MYDELVKRLRTAQTLAEFVAEETAKTPNTIFGEAADAIENLQDALSWKEHFDLLAEQDCIIPASEES